MKSRVPMTGTFAGTGHLSPSFQRTRLPPSPLHGGADRNSKFVPQVGTGGVAPSRGRGSKHGRHRTAGTRQVSPLHGGADRNLADLLDVWSKQGRPFTGARIETACRRASRPAARGRPFTGARIETLGPPLRPAGPSRPFTGARIETTHARRHHRRPSVAPSRGRGSKLS